MNPENPGNPDAQPNPPDIPPLLSGYVESTLAAEQSAPPPQPWGFWATFGWGVLIFIVNGIFQVAIMMISAALGAYGKSFSKVTKSEWESNGFVLALSLLLSTPVFCGLTILVAKLRRNMNLRDYFGLRWPSSREILYWSIGLVLLAGFSDLTMHLLDKPIVPPSMIEVYKTALYPPLLLLALIVAAPVGEELFFRGFMLEGFRRSRLGPAGAIILTSILWAALHIQYDAYGIAAILISGIFLGYARLRTGSLWLCICLHALMNSIATVQLLILLHMRGG